LYKISVDGGAVVPLFDLAGLFAGASWGGDGIIVGQAGPRGLVRIPSGGGSPTPVTEIANGEGQASPQLLPGGKAVLFAAGNLTGLAGDPDQATIDVVSLADHHRKTLVRGGAFPRYVASSNAGSKGAGHLLYVFQRALYAIAFDSDRLETRGAAVPILDDVRGIAQTVAGKFDVSQTGTLVYQKTPGGGLPMMTIQWLDSAGKEAPLLAKQGDFLSLRLAPDGKRLALSVIEGTKLDIEVYDWQSDRMAKLTYGGGFYFFPVWSPDGQYIIFTSQGRGMFCARSDGAGQPQMFTQGGTSQVQRPWSFSPDGRRLAYTESAESSEQIWTVPVEEQNGQLKAGTPEPFLKDQFVDAEPTFSPDGKWMAYTSPESGPREVYVRPFPPPASGQGGKWGISNRGGTNPVWSRTSHDLLYLAPDGQVMAASYTGCGKSLWQYLMQNRRRD
jgi:serine/threonine-protein kinase